jgi:hypothetical protein
MRPRIVSTSKGRASSFRYEANERERRELEAEALGVECAGFGGVIGAVAEGAAIGEKVEGEVMVLDAEDVGICADGVEGIEAFGKGGEIEREGRRGADLDGVSPAESEGLRSGLSREIGGLV